MDFRWTDGRTKPWTCKSRPAHLDGATTKYFLSILPGILCCRLHLLCSPFEHSTHSVSDRLRLPPGWSKSSLCAHVISLVLSWGGSFIEDFTWVLYEIYKHETSLYLSIYHHYYYYYYYWKNKEFRPVCRLLKNGVRISGILQNGVRILRKFQFRGQN